MRARAPSSTAAVFALLCACQDGKDADPLPVRSGADASTSQSDGGSPHASLDAGSAAGMSGDAASGMDASPGGERPSDAGLHDSAPQAAAGDAQQSGADAAAPAAPTPSRGCGKGGRPAGGQVSVANDHIYTFPTSYDGATPLPAVFAFHAANNAIDQLQNITRGSALANSYVMVFPKSSGSGWSLASDGPRLETWISDLLDNYCIDESRLFATGHSSGAQFIVQLLCRGERRFKAVAPVASSVYCPRWDALPALVIHGRNDMERANTSQDADGRKDLAPYLASNGCGMSSAAYAAASCTSGSVHVDPGCVRFDACQAPLVWCNHNDPSYSNTNHGWPCFANQSIFDFLHGLP